MLHSPPRAEKEAGHEYRHQQSRRPRRGGDAQKPQLFRRGLGHVGAYDDAGQREVQQYRAHFPVALFAQLFSSEKNETDRHQKEHRDGLLEHYQQHDLFFPVFSDESYYVAEFSRNILISAL